MDHTHGWFFQPLPTMETATAQDVLDNLNLFRLWLQSGESIGTNEVARKHIAAWLGLAHGLIEPTPSQEVSDAE